LDREIQRRPDERKEVLILYGIVTVDLITPLPVYQIAALSAKQITIQFPDGIPSGILDFILTNVPRCFIISLILFPAPTIIIISL